MPQDHEFPNLQAAAARLGARRDLSLADLRQLLCHDCDFWDDEHEDDLDCSCFRMLRLIIERGALSPAELSEMLGPGQASGEK